jgi:hypothetical protein
MPKSLLRTADNPNFNLHGIKLPARICVAASSGSGKTNWVVNFISLCSQGKGTFSKIHVITKDADEPLYSYLKLKSPDIQITEGLHTLPALNKFDKEEQSLVIVDDLVLAKDQSSISDYFCRCRKCGVTVIYLSQSYFRIPIFIRQNSNYVVILGIGNKRNMNIMLTEFSVGASKEQLAGMYKEATKQKLDCFLIDVDETNPQRKFRKNFNECLDPDDFGVDK